MTALPEEHTGRYRCPVCPFGFHSLKDKKVHLRDEHPRPNHQRKGKQGARR
jgi:hypothetical protein